MFWDILLQNSYQYLWYAHVWRLKVRYPTWCLDKRTWWLKIPLCLSSPPLEALLEAVGEELPLVTRVILSQHGAAWMKSLLGLKNKCDFRKRLQSWKGTLTVFPSLSVFTTRPGVWVYSCARWLNVHWTWWNRDLYPDVMLLPSSPLFVSLPFILCTLSISFYNQELQPTLP